MPLKVVHVGKFYPPHPGGIETHLQCLATGQKPFADVEVLVANDSPRTQRSIIDGIQVTRVATLGVVASVPVCPTLAHHLRAIRDADIVHLHFPNPGAAAAYLMSGHRGAMIVTHHSDILGRKHLRRLCEGFIRRVMERADAVIVTSWRYAESSAELRPFLGKCKVVPLGFAGRPMGVIREEDVAGIRRQYGQPLMLAVGRLVSYKGFEYLIRAMRRVEGNLLIVGSGPLAAPLKTLIAQHELGGRVHLLGHVGDLQAFYQAADIVVMPSISRAEAFGIVQLEAMACARPVINTDLNSGVPEVSIHGKTGLTVAPTDEVALADAITTLLTDGTRRELYGEAARERVLSEFDIDTMVRRTLQLYEGSSKTDEMVRAGRTGHSGNQQLKFAGREGFR